MTILVIALALFVFFAGITCATMILDWGMGHRSSFASGFAFASGLFMLMVGLVGPAAILGISGVIK
jgi:hypothetical protein